MIRISTNYKLSDEEKHEFSTYCKNSVVHLLNCPCKNNNKRIIYDSAVWYNKMLATFCICKDDANEILKEFGWKFDHVSTTSATRNTTQIRKYYFKKIKIK